MAIYYLLKIISLFPLSFLQYIARGIAHLLYFSDSSIKRITTINRKRPLNPMSIF